MNESGISAKMTVCSLRNPKFSKSGGIAVSSIRCPICQKRFESSDSASLPFCSERCRRVDLGRWLGESYSVPVERRDDDEGFDEEAYEND